jgi:hypothetical protein
MEGKLSPLSPALTTGDGDLPSIPRNEQKKRSGEEEGGYSWSIKVAIFRIMREKERE